MSSIPWLYLPNDNFIPGITCGQVLHEVEARIKTTQEPAWLAWLDPRLRQSTRLRLASEYLRGVAHSRLRASVSICAGVRFAVAWLAGTQGIRMFDGEPAIWATGIGGLGAGLLCLAFSAFVYWSLPTTALSAAYKIADELHTAKQKSLAS